MKVSYTCLYAGSDGESHFKDVEVEFQETDFAPLSMPLLVRCFQNGFWSVQSASFVVSFS